MLRLHGYFRSGTTHRVRIALNLKGLAYEQVAHHLLRGEHRRPDYLALNPQGLVPTLEDGPLVLHQSLAIMEYLEEAYPEPPLLPEGAAGRARVRALAHMVALDIHPLNNLRVLRQLAHELGRSEADRIRWARHWLAAGFGPLEAMLAGDARTGRFCHGDRPTLADVCLVPQVVSAARFAFDLEPYPTIRRIHAAALELDPFVRAMPANQPDAEA